MLRYSLGYQNNCESNH